MKTHTLAPLLTALGLGALATAAVAPGCYFNKSIVDTSGGAGGKSVVCDSRFDKSCGTSTATGTASATTGTASATTGSASTGTGSTASAGGAGGAGGASSSSPTSSSSATSSSAASSSSSAASSGAGGK